MTDITRYMDLTFKPIPRRCPIPPNSVAYLGGTFPDIDDTAGTTFILYKNKHELVIEGPPLDDCPELKHMDDYNKHLLLSRMYAEYLTIIEDLVPTIEFGNTRWARLVTDPHSGHQIIPDCNKQLRRVSCPVWAPIIPIEEIEFTVWGAFSDRRGIWNGKEVDIMYAGDDIDLFRVNRAMYGLRRVDGRDFTFELYGHLADRDGRIVGIVSEAAWGRPIGPLDKELVTSEIKRLESYGCIYRGCWSNQFLVADGKLRLIQLVCIKPYSDPEKLRRDAALFHAQHLDELFQEFEDYGPFGNFRLPPVYLTNSYEGITYLRHPITPRCPLGESMVYLQYFPRSGYRAVINHNDGRDDDNSSIFPIPAIMRRPQRETLRLVYSSSSRTSTSLQDEDAPLSMRSFRTRPRNRALALSGHPYSRMTLARFKALTNSERTESTIDIAE